MTQEKYTGNSFDQVWAQAQWEMIPGDTFEVTQEKARLPKEFDWVIAELDRLGIGGDWGENHRHFTATTAIMWLCDQLNKTTEMFKRYHYYSLIMELERLL